MVFANSWNIPFFNLILNFSYPVTNQSVNISMETAERLKGFGDWQDLGVYDLVPISGCQSAAIKTFKTFKTLETIKTFETFKTPETFETLETKMHWIIWIFKYI